MNMNDRFLRPEGRQLVVERMCNRGSLLSDPRRVQRVLLDLPK
jgi:hypothetical protein